jgi:predicted MFS family arabinose efflux permease
VTGAAALIGGLIVAYWSFTVLFLVMAAIDLVAGVVTWTGRLQSGPPAGAAPVDRASTGAQRP